jgi:hypothetical protein
VEKRADHVRADLPVAVNRDFGIGRLRIRSDREAADGNGKKTRKDYGFPPTTHESDSPTNKLISTERRGGSVTDYVEI